MKKHFFSLSVLFLFALFFYASKPSQKIQQPVESLIVPDYSFVPSSKVAPGSTGIRIALFKPVFPGNFTYASISPFSTFRTNMNRDLEQILTSKGYILKGPFDTYDDMMYSDKKECELGLFTDIDLNITQTSGSWRNAGSVLLPVSYSGTIAISGKITFYVSETFTKQKLLVKSLSIPQQIDVQLSSKLRYAGNEEIIMANKIPINDPGIHNPIALALVDFYKSTMKKASDMLEVEELKNLKAQAKDIRSNSNFKAN